MRITSENKTIPSFSISTHEKASCSIQSIADFPPSGCADCVRGRRSYAGRRESGGDCVEAEQTTGIQPVRENPRQTAVTKHPFLLAQNVPTGSSKTAQIVENPCNETMSL